MALRLLILAVVLTPVSLIVLSRRDSARADAASAPKETAPQASTYQQLLDEVPLPEQTPFDSDVDKRQQYVYSFCDGYLWSAGAHMACPTNPNETNHHAIRGWIDGWKAGAKNGGTSGLPAKYAPFIQWHDQ